MNKVLIGVSGGPDSMYLLNKLHNEGNEVIVAHVNYNLRPESIDEKEMVLKFCSDNNITIETLDITDEQWEEVKHLKNKQSMTREQRYLFYLKIAEKYEITDLYIAHHRDDFIETAFMQESRSDDYLFYGIQEHSIYKGLNIHRPLLDLYKDEIIESNDNNNIPYMIDKSNLEPIYERNKIRIELKDKSREEKDILFERFQKINKEKEIFRGEVDSLYEEFSKTNFEYSFYIQIEDQFKKYVIYKMLIMSEIRINISNDKLEGIIDFLKEKKGDKSYRLMENVFLSVKSNIIKIYTKI